MVCGISARDAHWGQAGYVATFHLTGLHTQALLCSQSEGEDRDFPRLEDSGDKYSGLGQGGRWTPQITQRNHKVSLLECLLDSWH